MAISGTLAPGRCQDGVRGPPGCAPAPQESDGMSPFHIRTPLFRSRPMSRTNQDIHLKLEALQPTGSFKLRGMGAICEQAVERGATHLVSSSGGNAGLAVAYAGERLGVRVTIYVPGSTPAAMRERIGAEGAEVKVAGSVWDDAHAAALAASDHRGAAYVHPFADPVAWAGHSTLVDEVAEDGLRPDAVVVAVGGGGLLCGVLTGMHRHGWTDVPVLAVETDGASCFYAAVKAGRPVLMDPPTSIATSLGARQVVDEAFAWTKRHRIRPWLVSDRAAVDACLLFADEHRLLVEPACGAALAAVHDPAAPLAGAKCVLVIVCGGAGVTLARLADWRERFRQEA
jgi:L-serine/L-threonine ammonia-lyase